MSVFWDKLKEATKLDLDEARLSEINVYLARDTLEIVLVCPEGVDKEFGDKASLISQAAATILATSFKVRVKIKKSYFDEAFFTYGLIGFLEKYPMVKHNVKSGNFAFERREDEIVVVMTVPKPVADYMKDRGVVGEIERYVRANYCENIVVEVVAVEVDDDIDFEPPETKLVYDYEGGRKIKVANVESFIGDPIYERPGYIVDARQGDGMVLCGRIKDFTERKRAMKEGETEQKYFFKFRLEDFTGSIDCIYFPTKKSLDKARLLTDGREVVLFGSVEPNTFRGMTTLTYKVRYVSLCTLPADFVINRARMLVPDKYRVVSPAPYESYEQDNIFETRTIPPFLMGKVFVVYDLETTGLNQAEDRIIEIGAVKIVDGAITERFTTLVDPERIIPEKSVSITGITDADVRGAPVIADVMPDFFKFCDGAIMVGQNSLQFDWPFLRCKAEPLNIYFENKQLDIMVLAKKFYPDFGRYNLDFLSKKFGIVNEEAHRADSDAITTAKIFIKIAANLQ